MIGDALTPTMGIPLYPPAASVSATNSRFEARYFGQQTDGVTARIVNLVSPLFGGSKRIRGSTRGFAGITTIPQMISGFN
jgi:hypothetical protein